MYSEIVERANKAYYESGLTQKQIAERANVSVTTVQGLLWGNHITTVVNFGKICKAMGVSADYVLYGKE